MTKEISVFVDESGSFSPAGADLHSPYYILCMVFHDQSDDMSYELDQLREAFGRTGIDPDHTIHAGPMIRREDEYRLFQVADVICTLELVKAKLLENGSISESEKRFFGGIKNFKKNYLKPLARKSIHDRKVLHVARNGSPRVVAAATGGSRSRTTAAWGAAILAAAATSAALRWWGEASRRAARAAFHRRPPCARTNGLQKLRTWQSASKNVSVQQKAPPTPKNFFQLFFKTPLRALPRCGTLAPVQRPD